MLALQVPLPEVDLQCCLRKRGRKRYRLGTEHRIAGKKPAWEQVLNRKKGKMRFRQGTERHSLGKL
jgi:hypothetical protein